MALLKCVVESYLTQNYEYPYAWAFPLSRNETSLKTKDRPTLPPPPVKRRRIPFFKREGYQLKRDADAVLIFDTPDRLEVCFDVLTHPRAGITFSVEDFGTHLRVASH